jgi:hypothetical protein
VKICDTLLIIFSGFDGWFCVLSGFFDETQKQKGRRMTGIGGFLFRKEELAAIQKKLADVGEPESASEIRNRGDIETLKMIARITADRRGEGFVVTLADDDFKTWASSRPSDAKWLGPAYNMCLLHLVDIKAVSGWHRIKRRNLLHDGIGCARRKSGYKNSKSNNGRSKASLSFQIRKSNLHSQERTS